VEKILTSWWLSVHIRNKVYIVYKESATQLISCFGDIWSLPPFCDVRSDLRFYQGDSQQFRQWKRSASKTSAKRQQLFLYKTYCESRC